MDKFWKRGEREKEKKCKNRKGSVDKFWNRKERKRERVRIGKDQ